MYKLTDFLKKRRLTFIVTSLSVLVLLLISSAAASVNDWEFSPQEPVCGDTISIKGNASPREKIDVFVTFEKTVPVSAGKFEYILEDVKIPSGLNNIFKVEARGAEDLNVRAKVLAWMTKSSKASGEIATVSQSRVPPGTYIIKIDGDAKEGTSNVDLKITAYQEIKADSNGDFSYSYNTKAVPAGDFEIKVGTITKKVTIQSETRSGSNSFSGGSSSKNVKPSPTVKNNSSVLPETEFSETITSENLEEKKDPENLTLGKNIDDEETKATSSEEDIQKRKFLGSSVDNYYALIGLGAAALILTVYSKRK